MREILFRGKRCDNGEWVQGCLVKFGKESFTDDDRYGIMDKTVLVAKTHTNRCASLVFGYCDYVYHNIRIAEIIPKSVGQFTGLTDMRGKKIFEGDILLSKVYEYAEEDIGWGLQRMRTGNKIDAVWTVEHKIYNAKCGYFVFGKDRRFHIPLTNSVIINGQCRVIGNIHDNPELLENP